MHLCYASCAERCFASNDEAQWSALSIVVVTRRRVISSFVAGQSTDEPAAPHHTGFRFHFFPRHINYKHLSSAFSNSWSVAWCVGSNVISRVIRMILPCEWMFHKCFMIDWFCNICRPFTGIYQICWYVLNIVKKNLIRKNRMLLIDKFWRESRSGGIRTQDSVCPTPAL